MPANEAGLLTLDEMLHEPLPAEHDLLGDKHQQLHDHLYSRLAQIRI